MRHKHNLETIRRIAREQRAQRDAALQRERIIRMQRVAAATYVKVAR